MWFNWFLPLMINDDLGYFDLNFEVKIGTFGHRHQCWMILMIQVLKDEVSLVRYRLRLKTGLREFGVCYVEVDIST
jgi:hypothetical protein